MPWTTITDAVLQVGAPIRALTLRLLRDNITAVANGDAGAPRVQNAALPDLVITANKIGGAQVHWWNLRSGNEERDWVLGRLAALDAGAVGTVAWARRQDDGFSRSITFGGTEAGSVLNTAGLALSGGAVVMSNGAALSGTWRALGAAGSSVTQKQTLWVRIA